LIGQLLVKDSLIARLSDRLGGMPRALATFLVNWLIQHPEISVRTTQNVLFYFYSTVLLTLSLVAIALAMPHLITRDLSSRAIIIYSSKAVTRFDYLLGKFSTLMGLMTLTWLGPICVAWFLGNLLAPNWGFFWHARVPLGNALLFIVSSMIILSLLGLGVSACSAREKATVSLWIGLWLLGNALVNLATITKPWLKFASFRYDLSQISLSVFRLGHELQVAQDNIQNVPFLGNMLSGLKHGPNPIWNDDPQLGGALCGLAVMLFLALLVISRKVKPE
jgi:hypothetical protein